MRSFQEQVCCSQVDVVIGKDYVEELNSINGRKAVVFSKNLKLEGLEADLLIPLDDGEQAKDLSTVLSIVREMFEKGFDRGDYVIAVGGGTVLDVVGFASSIYLRGLKLVNVPTTFLGMVDAGIGGKTGVNFQGIKNVLGTFYQPSKIVIDLKFLRTLPIEELKKGMAEVIKYSLTLDKELYDYLSLNKDRVMAKDEDALEEVVYRSVKDKLGVVKQDEREEKGIRIVLNFGHTIGHAIEAGSDFKVPHGYAISVGMVCEAKIAEEMGYSEEGVVEDVLWLLQLYNLPISVDQLGQNVSVEKALKAIGKDKKVRGGAVMMPFPTRIGDWKRVDVPLETLRGFAEQCLK
ncbi:MAG: 3-dehydroquinate synthase [Candidatus Aramenus sulfurataquae]|jgi:3-dehydroquinate synthase|uniref:3-dehydroquinate synthase n=3 Tax=Candidatus Aramenus sulfurataquae TaxID=1326980 RepID=A0AAE3FMQ8_9CREN|nr:3-dehydroquinate synthase [Candidatus Aramenus sulfurataquae]